MPKGTIARINKKGFGFIKLSGSKGDVFFHASNLKNGTQLDDLKEGQTVEFDLVQNDRRPGEQKAVNVKPVGSVARSPSGKSEIPYGFVPIDMELAVSDLPVWHNQREVDGTKLLSGEILCSLEVLTPLMAGNIRYKASQSNRDKFTRWGFPELPKEKQIAEPLRLSDGRIVIAGSSLKGMIRHSMGGLLSAPMERVAERHYTYRPNMAINSNAREKYLTRPAIVTAQNEGGWDIQVFDDISDALFVRDNAISKIQRAASEGVISGFVRGLKIDKRRVVLSNDSRANLDGYQTAIYKGGIDGSGKLAKAFNSASVTYRLALVPTSGGKPAHIRAELYERYLKDQKDVLANDISGHLTAHTLNSKFNKEKVSKDIVNNASLQVGQLIYVETDSNHGKVRSRPNILTFGHHFRYRWAYSSSVRKKNGRLRDYLKPTSDEQSSDGIPEKLTGLRLLFGYTRDDDTAPIGKGVHERLAGRIAINHAVSVGVPKFIGKSERGYCVPLPILGEPKSSAWECYLQSGSDAPPTYGDVPGDAGGELRGRKYYKHQPSIQEEEQIAVKEKDAINSDMATLARYICESGSKFKFTIRFARLRDWELGALLVALQPHRIKKNDPPEKYAHKLGFGRPLGLGSVRVSVDTISTYTESKAELETLNQDLQYEKVQELVKVLFQQPKAIQNATRWLDIHSYNDRGKLDYPTKFNNRSNQDEIFGWHTDIRWNYSKLRKLEDPEWSALKNRIREVHGEP